MFYKNFINNIYANCPYSNQKDFIIAFLTAASSESTWQEIESENSRSDTSFKNYCNRLSKPVMAKLFTTFSEDGLVAFLTDKVSDTNYPLLLNAFDATLGTPKDKFFSSIAKQFREFLMSQKDEVHDIIKSCCSEASTVGNLFPPEAHKKEQWKYRVMIIDDSTEQLQMLESELEEVCEDKPYIVEIISVAFVFNATQMISGSSQIDVLILDLSRGESNTVFRQQANFADFYRQLRDSKNSLVDHTKVYAVTKLRHEDAVRELENITFDYLRKQENAPCAIAKTVMTYLDGLYSVEKNNSIAAAKRMAFVAEENQNQQGKDASAVVDSTMNEDYYNLIVYGCYDPEDGQLERRRIILDPSRALTSYASDTIKSEFGILDSAAISRIKTFPSIIAYENNFGAVPTQCAWYGFITDVVVRENGVNVYFERKIELSQKALNDISLNLAIRKFEWTHSHWTIKKINLNEELREAGLMKDEKKHTTHIGHVTMHQTGEGSMQIAEYSGNGTIILGGAKKTEAKEVYYKILKAVEDKRIFSCISELSCAADCSDDCIASIQEIKTQIAQIIRDNRLPDYESGLATQMIKSCDRFLESAITLSVTDKPEDFKNAIATFKVALTGQIKEIRQQYNLRY